MCYNSWYNSRSVRGQLCPKCTVVCVSESMETYMYMISALVLSTCVMLLTCDVITV